MRNVSESWAAPDLEEVTTAVGGVANDLLSPNGPVKNLEIFIPERIRAHIWLTTSQH